MNTNSLKRFATRARHLLREGVRNSIMNLGFNDNGSVRFKPEPKGNSVLINGRLIDDSHFFERWNALHERVKSIGVKEVIEEAAYTWFNRIMAIRILEFNCLAPAVLDYENPEIFIPGIVTDARTGKTPLLSDEERTALDRVMGDGLQSFEQFAILIRAYCENNPIIHKCFGGITDYTLLLLPTDILAEGNFIYLLNFADEFIKPEDYRKPELIGWLYQFYISERKDEVFAKKGSYESEDIPAATQIFTPNWIVKYMVENTLGRIYLDNNPDSSLAENWKYLVTPAEPTSEEAKLRYDSLEQLTCGDLSCGSGHILNEMFDLLMQLYADEFYSPREAVEAILRKNIIGIDIDERARQLAQFALLLKACQTDSVFVDGHCMPRVYSMPKVWPALWSDVVGHFNCAYQIRMNDDASPEEIKEAFYLMEKADVLGSIMKFDISQPTKDYLELCVECYEDNPLYEDNFEPIINAYRVILALTEKYAVLCMNPPYMPTSKEPKLKAYAAKNYPDSKADLFAVFMDLAIDRLREYGKYGMINMQSWMFLSSFESLRKKIIENQQIDSLLHLGPRTFDELSGEVVQNAAFVISNQKPSYPGIYYRLINGSNCNAKREMFLAGDNRHVIAKQKQFEQIPGVPIAYWVSQKILDLFSSDSKLEDHFAFREGIHTADNNRFLRIWHEVSRNELVLDANSYKDIDDRGTYIPYNKGGSFRKWYGNNEIMIGFNHKKRDEMASLKSHVRPSQELYFKEGGTWSAISNKFAIRYYPTGQTFSQAGQVCIGNEIFSAIGFLNSSLFAHIASFTMPGLDFKCGVVKLTPDLRITEEEIHYIVSSCISISRQDWDAHETSWDFNGNELLNFIEEEAVNYAEFAGVKTLCVSLESLIEDYESKWKKLFFKLHNNEEELNRKFIEIYNLQDELTPDVLLEDVTILQNGEIKIENGQLVWQRDNIIKQFISYAVGCMMGRYRLDRPGLAIAHPNPAPEEYAPYTVPQTGEEWWIDDDGIVPMLDENCGFHDNAANRFNRFMEVALGDGHLTENMNFVREALGKDVVDYLRTDFYADHKRMYQNRPIYWMFSSNQKGKRAAFQCLVYMHRMNRYTPEHIRTDYLLPYIDRLAAREAELSARTSLTAKENKLLKQLRNDLEECRDYQLCLHEFADRQIEIDLDDGVVKNYATFAPVLAKLK